MPLEAPSPLKLPPHRGEGGLGGGVGERLMMEEWHVQDSRMAVIKHPGIIKVLVICVSVADEAIPEN